MQRYGFIVVYPKNRNHSFLPPSAVEAVGREIIGVGEPVPAASVGATAGRLVGVADPGAVISEIAVAAVAVKGLLQGVPQIDVVRAAFGATHISHVSDISHVFG